MADSKGKGKGGRRRSETEEYELGDDFLTELDQAEDDDEDLDPETYERDELTDGGSEDEQLDPDEPDEPDELDEVVSAETVEWSPEDVEDAEPEDEEDQEPEADRAPAEAEQTLVAAAEAGETRGGWARARAALGSPFRWLRRHRMPLWARFSLAAFLIVGSMATATANALIHGLVDIADDLRPIPGVSQWLTPVPESGPQTILILGSDLRPSDVAEGLVSKNYKGLSDTTMLLRLDPDRDAIALFSLPRDLKVSIPGYGTDKLNAAYAIGGPQLTLRTVEGVTGLDVNHLVNVDFEGFARAVNHIDCVYVDVDRRYVHSNAETTDDYEEIHLQPGYQALCGYDALDYVRYRHTDNDVVRAARQQDFLREARHKVPTSRLIEDHKDLINIFTKYTSSDVNDWQTMLEVMKLFIQVRNAPVKEIHFEGTLGPTYVTATTSEMHKAVNQFLGIQDTPGARGSSAAADTASGEAEAQQQSAGTPAERRKAKKAAKAAKARRAALAHGSTDVVATSYGKQLAQGMRGRKMKLPIYYPTVLEAGTDYAQKPRVYKINGTGPDSPPAGQRQAYKWVFSRPALGEYYGFEATRWEDPPILDSPSETHTFGGQDYDLYYDGDRLRMIAWQNDDGSFWLTNTLIQSLSDAEMVQIARGMRELPKRGK
jgi:polyisoprenyl-teichoic acid--peptidoglycan teichoic acid transferase